MEWNPTKVFHRKGTRVEGLLMRSRWSAVLSLAQILTQMWWLDNGKLQAHDKA